MNQVMQQREKLNILLVDDQPAKLLSLQTILAPLGENIIQAGSANEALRLLLSCEVAVVLVDVCMPTMDGFELAELIREHPRYSRTAIMFISAVQLTDDDRLRGYNLGAVDYIPVPIIPEVLRAKVAVFTELYRKTDQLARLNAELEHRVRERTAALEASAARLAASERNYRDLVQSLAAAVYTCDINGKVSLFNQAAVDLWGAAPRIGVDEWGGTWNVLRIDGTPLPVEESPMALTLRHGRSIRDQELIVQRPDGTRRCVMPFPEPIQDEAGNIIGAVTLLADITDTRNAEETRNLLAAIVASSDDAIISKTLDGTITSWNAGAERMFGYTAPEAVGRSIMMLVPRDNHGIEMDILHRLGRGEHLMHFETTRVARDGRIIDISLTVSPLRDRTGAIVGASAVAKDITQRKNAEAVLARDRETLEHLVEERTAELERSNQRLRVADRMATIGTLSAGLGHDMGNLLLPIRMRLDAMEAAELPAPIRDDLAAIRKASEYLQKLAASLRLLSLDAQSERPEESSTRLDHWWSEASPMIRNGLPRTVRLQVELPPSLPPVRIGPAALTQIVFNLVQNAGDALRNRPEGLISIGAAYDAESDRINLTVKDNGPGMTEEARRRCLEPFFTTKTRGLSTGLGLALVNGLLKSANGTIQVDSLLDHGATFTIQLCAARTPPRPADRRAATRGTAIVTLRDPRLAAHARWIFDSLHYTIEPASNTEAQVWLTDASTADAMHDIRKFIAQAPSRRVLVFSHDNRAAPEPRVTWISPAVKPSALRAMIASALSLDVEVTA